MKTLATYKEFERDKGLEEQLYEISKWQADLDFLKLEIPFLKSLIQSYPFKIKIPNLFEKIQLYIKDLDRIVQEKIEILVKIKEQKKQLSGMLECDDLICDDFFISQHKQLAKEVFDFLMNYKKLKARLIEFISGIIN